MKDLKTVSTDKVFIATAVLEALFLFAVMGCLFGGYALCRYLLGG